MAGRVLPTSGEIAVTADDLDRRGTAVQLAALLLAAGVVVAASPLAGMVRAADGSAISAFGVAGWVAVLPGVLAVGLALVRPALGLAATAGAGLVGIARFVADLAVVTETDRVSRPELFVESTDRARPFQVGAVGWVLLVGDLIMVVVGVLAARRLAVDVLAGDEPRGDALFGGPVRAGPPADRASPAKAGAPASTDDVGDVDEDTPAVSAVAAMSDSPSARRRLNLPMVGLGFLGSVLLLVGGLDVPYTGGYLALRVLPFGTSVSGVAAAVLLAFITAAVVLVAAALPRDLAQALLAGTALAAAVPSLTAVVAVLLGAPTGLSPVVWWGLAGAVVLAAAGLLARRDLIAVRSSDDVPSPRAPTMIAGGLGLAGAAALGVASTASLLYLDGAPPDDVAGGLLAPAALPLLVAAVPPAVAAVLALVPGSAVAGRAALMVAWAGAGYTLGRAFWAMSLVSATSTGSTSGITHSWTVGPGGWLMVLGAVLAVLAAVYAAIGHRRAAEASPEVVDDDALARSRRQRRWLAVALSVAVPVALALPAYTGLGVSSAPSLVHGLDLDTWAFWLLAVGGWSGIWLGATTRYPQASAAGPVAAAAVVVQPLVIPGVVRDLPGFTLDVGFWVILVLTVAMLPVAAVFARSAAGIGTRSPWPGGTGEPRSRLSAESKGGRR